MRLRQIFRRTGWKKGCENGIETVIEHERKKQIAVMSTDFRNGGHKPIPKKPNYQGAGFGEGR